jgi:hypothetical protein
MTAMLPKNGTNPMISAPTAHPLVRWASGGE